MFSFHSRWTLLRVQVTSPALLSCKQLPFDMLSLTCSFDYCQLSSKDRSSELRAPHLSLLFNHHLTCYFPLNKGKNNTHFCFKILTQFLSIWALKRVSCVHTLKTAALILRLKGFDLILVSANVNSLKEPDSSCCYFHMQSLFYPLEIKSVSAFSAFLFLFKVISKNLPKNT